MSLLAPWFLAGLGLLAVPVLAHLIRRATRDRVAFSAVRFLTASAPRLDRRSRIQHPLLLALRLLILALLALAFARPYFDSDSPLAPVATPPRHVLVVLDRSASMQRPTLWESAQEKVATIASSLSEPDDFTLILADDHHQVLLPATTWRDTAPGDRRSLLAGLLAAPSAAPGYSAFYLDDAVQAALEAHQELNASDATPPTAPVIHVVSDLAAGSRISGLASLAWPTGTELILDRIGEDASTANVSLQWLGWVTAAEDDALSARVRLVATGDVPTTSVRLTLHDPQTDSPLGPSVTQVISRSNAHTTVLVPVPADAPEALVLRLEDDAVAFDNTLWIVRPQDRTLPVILLSSQDPADPTQAAYYLTRAMSGWRDPLPALTREMPPVSGHNEGSRLPAFILAPSPMATANLTEVVAQMVIGATTLLIVDSPEAAAQAARLLGEEPWPYTAAPATSDYALLGQIDFTHPLFQPFADPRYSDFSRIRFWSHPRLSVPADSTAQIIARFDDGSPAVLEAAVDDGRLVVWVGGWTPTQSQWVLSSKFVPWLQNLAERTAGGPLRAAVTTLDQLPALGPYTSLVGSYERERVAPSQPSRPGLYQLTRDNLPPRTVALNVPERESDLSPLDRDVFAQLGAPVHTPDSDQTSARADQQRRQEAATLAESRQKLWRWLLLAAALLLIAESLFSLRIARRTAATT